MCPVILRNLHRLQWIKVCHFKSILSSARSVFSLCKSQQLSHSKKKKSIFYSCRYFHFMYAHPSTTIYSYMIIWHRVTFLKHKTCQCDVCTQQQRVPGADFHSCQVQFQTAPRNSWDNVTFFHSGSSYKTLESTAAWGEGIDNCLAKGQNQSRPHWHWKPLLINKEVLQQKHFILFCF